MNQVKHRRNHALAGLGLVLSAGLFGWGVSQPLIELSGPNLTADLGKGLGLSLDPSLSQGSDEATQIVGVTIAACVGLMGLLLLVTRIRYLGLLWRVVALTALAGGGYLVYVWWTFVQDPTASSDSEVARFVAQSADALGLIKLSPGLGLYLMAGGVVLGVLACLIPAFRSQREVSIASTAPSPPPGWYPTAAGGVDRYWDGQRWAPD